MAKAVKMQDIAERLGVSTMTISKALSGKPGVSEVMREKIKKLAVEMGYIAPGTERNEFGKSYNIGVILAEYYTEKYTTFYWKLYQSLSTSAVRKNCFVMLEIISCEDESNLELPRLIQERKIDGLLVLGSMRRDYLKMLAAKENIPVVYVDFYDNCVHEDSVVSNSFYGAYAITNYLFEKGHRRIGFVGTLFSTKSITDRFMGYEKAMIENGEKVREEWIIPDREQARSSYEKITLPMEMPTAFVCNSDLTASKLVRSLYEKGYQVPEDISVVGYDDFLCPGLCDVEITTYGVDMEHMAETTIQVMLKRIMGNVERKGIHVIEGYIAEKESVSDIRQNS